MYTLIFSNRRKYIGYKGIIVNIHHHKVLVPLLGRRFHKCHQRHHYKSYIRHRCHNDLDGKKNHLDNHCDQSMLMLKAKVNIYVQELKNNLFMSGIYLVFDYHPFATYDKKDMDLRSQSQFLLDFVSRPHKSLNDI